MMISQEKVVVVGGGPIGALAALYTARRGFQVELYELRDDPNFGDPNARPAIASIPLSFSERGIRAIEGAGVPGLIEDILAGSRPMDKRTVHTRDENGRFTAIPMPYGPHGECLHNLPREKIAKRLLLALEKEPNATVIFNHKLVSCDFKNKVSSFERVIWKTKSAGTKNMADDEPCPVDTSNIKVVHFNFLIGCDGAHSAIRQSMMRQLDMDFQQSYMDALWCDFVISPTSDGQYRLNPQSMHVWSAKDSIMIAGPDFDGSFRAGMIARTDVCRELETHPEKVEAFLRTMHPGIIPNLMSSRSAIEQFVSHPHISLKSVKCSNFGYGDSAVLLGDSSHSMTPFFAMGMITGLEDVRIFFEDFIDPVHRSRTNNEKVERPFCPTGVVRRYTDHRRPDVQAMTDMAAEHYHELNTGVRSKTNRYKHWIVSALQRYAPILDWGTLYWRVQFGHERFSVIRKKEERQKKIIESIVPGFFLTWLLTAVVLFVRYADS